VNDQSSEPVSERAIDTEADTPPPQTQPASVGVQPVSPADPDDRLSYVALGAIVVVLALCASLILIAYVNGPA
jgi:hypothetical protein